MRRSDQGFTLIEVLAAVLIVSLVFGLLLESVTRNLADLGRARAESRRALLAADRVRELKAELEAGEKLEDGVKDGVFDEPDSDMKWQLTVTPQTLALPADYPGELPPSPLFGKSNEPPRAGNPAEEPPLRLVQVRVFAPDEDPESAEPFVVLLAAPPDPAKLTQRQQQLQGQQPQGEGEAGSQPQPRQSRNSRGGTQQ
jgi:prepilin-type N-terminal cleavage/methylation domain-containing protein